MNHDHIGLRSNMVDAACCMSESVGLAAVHAILAYSPSCQLHAHLAHLCARCNHPSATACMTHLSRALVIHTKIHAAYQSHDLHPCLTLCCFTLVYTAHIPVVATLLCTMDHVIHCRSGHTLPQPPIDHNMLWAVLARTPPHHQQPACKRSHHTIQPLTWRLARSPIRAAEQATQGHTQQPTQPATGDQGAGQA